MERETPTFEEQARCNLACLLHLVGMVERDEIEEAKKYAEYVRAMLRLAERYKDKPAQTFTCPKCFRTSHNPNDAKECYCGACHEFFK